MKKETLIIQLLQVAAQELRNKANMFSSWAVIDAYNEAADAIDALAEGMSK